MGDAEEPLQNPIVALAQRIRARRDLGAAIDSATDNLAPAAGDDAAARFAALAEVLAIGAKRLNSILGKRSGVTFVRTRATAATAVALPRQAHQPRLRRRRQLVS